MSDALPVVSGDRAIAAFARLGYAVVAQKGSHVRLRHPAHRSASRCRCRGTTS